MVLVAGVAEWDDVCGVVFGWVVGFEVALWY